MIVSFINRAFGRVSLRGVAWVRHVALSAATGLKQYAAGHSSSTGIGHARGGRERVGLDSRSSSGLVHHPGVSAGLVRSWAGSFNLSCWF